MEDGLDIKLGTFFRHFEDGLSSFDPHPHRLRGLLERMETGIQQSSSVRDLLKESLGRLVQAVEATGLTTFQIGDRASIHVEKFSSQFHESTLANVLRFSVFVDVPPGELLFGDGPVGQLIDPDRLRYMRLSEEKLREKLLGLSEALEHRRRERGKTETDLQTGAGLQVKGDFDPVLRGKPEATLARFLQVCEGLLRAPHLPGREGWVDTGSLRREAREILSGLDLRGGL